MSYNTRFRYTGDGTTTNYTIPFNYKYASEVKVQKHSDGSSIPFTFLSENVIAITTPAPLDGVEFDIFRLTDITTPAVKWQAGGGITADNLNKMSAQMIDSMQEIYDANLVILGTVGPDPSDSGIGPVSVDAIALDGSTSDYDRFVTSITKAASTLTGSYGKVTVAYKEGYDLSNSIQLRNGQRLDGSDGGQSIIRYQPASGPAIITYGSYTSLRDLWVKGPGANANTTLVGVQMGTGEHGKRNNISDMLVEKFTTGIDVRSTEFWSIKGTVVNDFSAYGIRVRNIAVPDAGDGTIEDTVVEIETGSLAPESLIRYESGGGLKISNFKGLGGFNPGVATGATYGLHVKMDGAILTQDLMVTNSSFENCNSAGIKMERGDGAGAFGGVVVSNNEFAGMAYGIWLASVEGNATRNSVESIGIANNVFSTLSQSAIRIDPNNNNVVVGHNVYSHHTPVEDFRVDFTDESGWIERTETLGGLISTTPTWSRAWRIDVPSGRACKVAIFLEGKVDSDGFAYDSEFIVRNTGSTMELTSIRGVNLGATIQYAVDVTTLGQAFVLFCAASSGQTLKATGTIKTAGKIKRIVRRP